MATVELNQNQIDVLRDLGLPSLISTDIGDDEWCEIQDRLLDEVQHHGFNETFDGENEYGVLCSSIYNAMVELEELSA